MSDKPRIARPTAELLPLIEETYKRIQEIEKETLRKSGVGKLLLEAFPQVGYARWKTWLASVHPGLTTKRADELMREAAELGGKK